MIDYKFTLKRAAVVSVIAAATALGFCALAEIAKAQQCIQWSCTWVNTNTANPIQYCTCVLVAAPSASTPPGPYASDAPVDFLKPYR